MMSVKGGKTEFLRGVVYFFRRGLTRLLMVHMDLKVRRENYVLVVKFLTSKRFVRRAK